MARFNRKAYCCGLAVAAAALGYASVASATTLTYSLTTPDCSGGCGTAPYGTVTVSSISSTEVSVDVALSAGENFATTGAGSNQAILFDLSGNPTISVSNLTTGFTADDTASGATIHADGTGDWQYGVSCSSCSGGTGPTGPLAFDITVAGGITPASFVINGDSLFFAADIMGTTGNTGLVGAPTAVVSTTPLPAAFPMFGAVLFGAGGMLGWRKRRTRSSIPAVA